MHFYTYTFFNFENLDKMLNPRISFIKLNSSYCQEKVNSKEFVRWDINRDSEVDKDAKRN